MEITGAIELFELVGLLESHVRKYMLMQFVKIFICFSLSFSSLVQYHGGV